MAGGRPHSLQALHGLVFVPRSHSPSHIQDAVHPFPFLLVGSAFLPTGCLP